MTCSTFQIRLTEKKTEHLIPDPDTISLKTICKSTGKTVD
jgi:hypothetical protein